MQRRDGLMVRTDDDTWDINESVGATALGVAGGRAAETNSADPLISDPYARLFIEAAGDGIWKIFLDDEPPAELADVDPRFKERMQASMSYMGSLFDRIQSLSARRSRIAVEAFTNDFFSAESFARREEQMEQYRAIATKLGGKDITESGNLLYEEERTEVTDWLGAHGWEVTATTAEDLLASNNRSIPSDLGEVVPDSVFVDGRLP